MNRNEWREIDSVTRSSAWRIAAWIIVAVVFFGGLTAGIWWLKVATSDIKGAGDQTQIVNDGRNRVNAQEWFEGQYELVRATDAKLDGLKRDLDANLGKPDEAFYRTNFTGTQNLCIQQRAAYNAESRKVSRSQWRSPDLPYQLDDTDPTTDCKETAK